MAMPYAPFGMVNEALDAGLVSGNQLDKQISTLLGRLQAPWVSDRTDNRQEGWMYKRQNKAPHKWVMFRIVLNGNNLYYFSGAVCKIFIIFVFLYDNNDLFICSIQKDQRELFLSHLFLKRC